MKNFLLTSLGVLGLVLGLTAQYTCETPTLLEVGQQYPLAENDIDTTYYWSQSNISSPHWFYFQMCELDAGGEIRLNTFGYDAGFALRRFWVFGPFDAETFPDACNSLDSTELVSDFLTIGSGTQYEISMNDNIEPFEFIVGAYYLLLVDDWGEGWSGATMEIAEPETSVLGNACIACLPFESPEICIVTSGNNDHPVVVWEKWGEDDNISEYRIYREEFGEDVLVGVRTAADSSFFEDVDVFAWQQSYVYKMETVDTCGISDWTDFEHTTIHLAANLNTQGGANLIWNRYFDGTVLSPPFPEQLYYIYRGSSLSALTVIDSLASGEVLTSFSYTDPTELSESTYYQIAFFGPGCSPTRDEDYILVKSNPVQLTADYVSSSPEAVVRIYPNPVNDHFRVETSGQAIREIKLWDVLSQPVLLGSINQSGSVEVDVSRIPAGAYLLEVRYGDHTTSFHRLNVSR